MTKPAVFISSSVEGLAAARELARQLETSAAVTIWSDAAFRPGQLATESLTEVAKRSDFAVFVLTADQADDSSSGPVSRWSPRSNVIFELGMLLGLLGQSRTFIIVGDAESASLPTDLTGTMQFNLSTRQPSDDLRARIAPAADAIRRVLTTIDTRDDHSLTEYYSCFISYSSKDQEFAARLHDDLSHVGVRSWLDARELKIGDRLSDAIDKAIQAHDKVLLVLSESSVQSPWVIREVNNSLRLEQSRRKTVLFPIRLDDAVFRVSGIREIDLLTYW